MDHNVERNIREKKALERSIESEQKMKKVAVAAGAVGMMWFLKLIFKYPYMFLKFIVINPWGNVGIGGLGAFSVLGQYFGWIDPSVEISARQIELDGGFDWTMIGFCLIILIVGIFRLVGGEVHLRKLMRKDQSEN